MVLGDELACVGQVPAFGEGDDVASASWGEREALDCWRLGVARAAPAGPEVEDDDFALLLIIAKADGLGATAGACSTARGSAGAGLLGWAGAAISRPAVSAPASATSPIAATVRRDRRLKTLARDLRSRSA